MTRLEGSVCVDAPAPLVWTALARIEDIHLWSEAVRDSRCKGPISRGVGAERTCDRTLLTSEAEVVLKGGRAGRLLEPLLRLQFSRMGSRTLAAFNLVEHGEPSILTHAKLPRAPAACC